MGLNLTMKIYLAKCFIYTLKRTLAKYFPGENFPLQVQKNESNVGLRSQKGWEQGRVVGTVRGMLTLVKV